METTLPTTDQFSVAVDSARHENYAAARPLLRGIVRTMGLSHEDWPDGLLMYGRCSAFVGSMTNLQPPSSGPPAVLRQFDEEDGQQAFIDSPPT
jgi:hypothetical protein